MKQKLYLLIAIFISLFSFGQTLDQSNINTPSGGVTASDAGEMVGQSFTAGISGTLSKISFYFNNPIATNYNLKVYSGAGNTGVLLGTQDFSVSASTPSGEFEIPISITINISAGTIYTAYVSRNDMMLPEITFGTSYSNVYLGGSCYSNNISITSYDLWFKTFITPPPVAATYLNFDGIDDHIIVSNENNFDFTNQMTVEFWMQSSTAPEQWDAFIAKGDDSWRIALTVTGTVAFAGTGAFTDFYSTTSVTDGNWHHVAVSYNGTNARIYIDGILESSISATGNIDNSSYAVSIGENLQQTGRFYNGNLDDIRIWNVARTATEISSSKNCALHGNETNLLAYYKLNQGISGEDNSAITTITNTVPIISQATLQNFSLNGVTSNFLAGATPVTTITYTLVQNNVSCNGLYDGSIIVTASGGQEPYTFSWSTGNTNNTISNYGPGVYNLYSITDATGCYIGVTGAGLGVGSGILEQITITQPAVLGIPTVTTPVVYTQGATATALTATTGSNGTGLVWYTTAAGSSAIATPTPSTVSPGNTSYWVVSTNANGCESNRVEIVVTVSASATAGCWAKIEAGNFHTLAIAQNGTLWSWGYNNAGQLGLGDSTDRNTPTQVGTDTNWQNVSAGINYTLGIKTDGTLWSWGANIFGYLGLGDFANRNIPTQIGTDTNWQSISCGYYHALATKTNGTLWSWGYNSFGQLGLGDLSDRNAPLQVGTDTNWKSISCGGFNTLATKTNGTLWSWGYNNQGQLGLGDNSNRNTPIQLGADSNWQSIYGGRFHTLATKINGTLWSWGKNEFGQLGLGDNSDRNVPVQVGTDINWQSISGGRFHTLATKTSGTLWSWGFNNEGELGLGDTSNRNTPVQVGTETNWQRITCGDYHTLATNTDGVIWSWGDNTLAELGLGDTTNRNTPVQVACPAVLSSDYFSLENTVIIYPNPSNGIFTIETKEDSTVEVYDMIGKKVLSKKISIGSSNLDLSNYTNGIYFLTITNPNGGFKTFKLIKQ